MPTSQGPSSGLWGLLSGWFEKQLCEAELYGKCLLLFVTPHLDLPIITKALKALVQAEDRCPSIVNLLTGFGH